MRGFFSSMNRKASNDVFFGLPSHLRSAVSLRLNGKDQKGFTLRTHAGIDYVVSYTDPISGLIISQSIASRQPVKLLDSISFDASDDGLLYEMTTPLDLEEVWMVVESRSANFLGNEVFFSNPPKTVSSPGYNSGGSPDIFGTTGSTNFINISPSRFQNLRINNVSTLDASPLTSVKTISFQKGVLGVLNEVIGIGTYDAGLGVSGTSSLNGNVYDTIFLNRVLTNSERIDMQNYLQDFHLFTP